MKKEKLLLPIEPRHGTPIAFATLFCESYGMEKHGISKAREENIVGESEARSKAKD